MTSSSSPGHPSSVLGDTLQWRTKRGLVEDGECKDRKINMYPRWTSGCLDSGVKDPYLILERERRFKFLFLNNSSLQNFICLIPHIHFGDIKT